ncbi:hypothetical protein [Escherichia phage dw-ec]|nr:hypothetical protein [Escherichia phage dw-ec]
MLHTDSTHITFNFTGNFQQTCMSTNIIVNTLHISCQYSELSHFLPPYNANILLKMETRRARDAIS